MRLQEGRQPAQKSLLLGSPELLLFASSARVCLHVEGRLPVLGLNWVHRVEVKLQDAGRGMHTVNCL